MIGLQLFFAVLVLQHHCTSLTICTILEQRIYLEHQNPLNQMLYGGFTDI